MRCFDGGMTTSTERIARATRIIEAPAAAVFELIADPSRQPEWDGNDNLLSARPGQRVRAVGDVFVMTLKDHLPGTLAERENVVVEFDEGRLIAWTPRVPGQLCPGHLWRWELEPLDGSRTRVTHTYDWDALEDEARRARAEATTESYLMASIDRLSVRVAAGGRS